MQEYIHDGWSFLRPPSVDGHPATVDARLPTVFVHPPTVDEEFAVDGKRMYGDRLKYAGRREGKVCRGGQNGTEDRVEKKCRPGTSGTAQGYKLIFK